MSALKWVRVGDQHYTAGPYRVSRGPLAKCWYASGPGGETVGVQPEEHQTKASAVAACETAAQYNTERRDRMATNHRGQIWAICGKVTTPLTRPERLAVLSYIATRPVSSTNDLNARELEQVAGTLFSWDAAGHLDAQLAEILRVAA